ncbi:MAG: ATP-binding protein [Actinobacteria bacterium]|nr:ATP-binding protein [Actinomycetota bacterium]
MEPPSRRGSLVASRGHRFRLTRGPAAPAAARRALVGLAVPAEASREKLRLLVSDLVTNSVRYAPGGPAAPLDLLVGVADGGVRVEVSDGGDGFQPARVDPSRKLTSGWGLYLVDALADRWGVAQGKPTRVWFELIWRRESPETPAPPPAHRSLQQGQPSAASPARRRLDGRGRSGGRTDATRRSSRTGCAGSSATDIARASETRGGTLA